MRNGGDNNDQLTKGLRKQTKARRLDRALFASVVRGRVRAEVAYVRRGGGVPLLAQHTETS
jgi:hypothetical protein